MYHSLSLDMRTRLSAWRRAARNRARARYDDDDDNDKPALWGVVRLAELSRLICRRLYIQLRRKWKYRRIKTRSAGSGSVRVQHPAQNSDAIVRIAHILRCLPYDARRPAFLYIPKLYILYIINDDLFGLRWHRRYGLEAARRVGDAIVSDRCGHMRRTTFDQVVQGQRPAGGGLRRRIRAERGGRLQRQVSDRTGRYGCNVCWNGVVPFCAECSSNIRPMRPPPICTSSRCRCPTRMCTCARPLSWSRWTRAPMTGRSVCSCWSTVSRKLELLCRYLNIVV